MAENMEQKKSETALREERILEFWEENKTFEKSLKQTEGRKEFIFYDGPVTANSKPVLHTMVPFSFKDAIPRYKTMQSFHVRRKGGWDTQGLPVELQIEKKLGFNSKNDIENYGIAAFNKLCRESVWDYIELWKNFTNRMGYWADQENAYVTYHNDYIESVWNIVKKINEQKLLYKDYKVVPWCPRCGTSLSSHELAQGYEDVKDLSVTAKFKVVSSAQKNPSALLHPSDGTFRLQDSSAPTYILAWTTTPWTLPGNVALAVGEKLDYVKIKVGNEILILAKARLSVVTEPYEILEELKGKDLLGLEYEPLYPFLANTIFETEKYKMEKAYRVYPADFVTTEDGTGIVHTAVMYGQDDFVLGTKVGLPKHHLVGLDGRFLAGTGIFEGRFVRDEEVAVDIIKDLAHRGLLFKKEKYEHSYPHCWRCKTALIYYARDSWYIKVSDPKIKDKMIVENKKINWEPAHIRDGRFGEWLREIKDWAVSRERYWGTPLPVWICEDCKKVEVMGSVEEIKEKTKKSGNKYFVMRHGESENNAANIYSSDPNINHLTEKGKAGVLKTAEELKNKNVTKIFCSPFLRTRETADIIAEKIGLPKDKIVYDERLSEFGFGDFSGKSMNECLDHIGSKDWRYDTRVPGGESFQDAKRRFGEFLYEVDAKNKNETILIVSHGFAVEVAPAVIVGADKRYSLEIFNSIKDNQTASLHKEHTFVPIPHNENYELDLHRPYIDEINLVCKCGGSLVRTKEVMDVWFDSGAMPFAQDHYPFENKKWVDGPGYPADFISEAIDQTRGWFYTLHAVGVLMGRGKAYKNVICLGHLLDAKGKKMSKSLGNIVDPWDAMDKYGADTLRLWMYSVNQPGESKNFDEKTVALLHQQIFGLLYNVLVFYELYRNKETERLYLEDSKRSNLDGKNILDQWILARLNELIKISTENLDNYKLLEPTRAIRDFIGDLSTWYLRRSRERIKEGDKNAKQTLYFILKNSAKILAPFAPLAAEDIWLKLKNEKDMESVHLESWPKAEKINIKILEDMKKVREIVTLGLEARQKAGIKVRQPLSSLEVKDFVFEKDFIELIKDEINVREVKENKNIENDVLLDTEITPELKQEGDYRELVRALQDIRKKIGLTPSDVVSVVFETNEKGKKLIQKFEADMKKTVLISKIEFKNNSGEEIKIDDLLFKVKIEKI
jgi:isoleucyl-tRNA synthetase